MDIVVLISSGKDSALALNRVMKQNFNVKYLVSVIPRRDDSWMFHYPNAILSSLFAEATGIPLVTVKTSGIKDKEIEDLEYVLSKLNVEGVASGAILSKYQKNNIDALCERLNLTSIAPLWKENQVSLIREIIDNNFHVIITGVYALGFNKSWLGRTIDNKTLNSLKEMGKKFGISIVGEGGEYESLVLDAPYFTKRIKILEKTIVWGKDAGYLLVDRAELVNKIP